MNHSHVRKHFELYSLFTDWFGGRGIRAVTMETGFMCQICMDVNVKHTMVTLLLLLAPGC